MTKNDVINSIKIAFSNVSLGNGVGLWQTQAMDNYESVEIQKQIRVKDIKDDWSLLSSEELQICQSSLSFFDAAGMKFHLPAYIVRSMTGEVDNPIFHLTNLNEHAKSKLATLSSEQAGAVVYYLEWCLVITMYWRDWADIQKLIDCYWVTRI